MPAIRLSVAARSDVGRVREKNEDAYTVADLDTGVRIEDATAMTEMDVRERGVLMVVSDGMGGHAAGEVASALVVDSLRSSLGESDHSESMDRLMEKAVQRANADVFEAARDSTKHGMGATLTAVLVHGQEAYIAEVGDSRAYLLRRGRLRQMTKDQSFVQLLLDAGAITTEQAKDFANKNWIAQAMGLEPNVRVELGKLQLRRGDRLLLCCDGLYSLVEDDELAALLGGDNLSDACNRMIDLANERGGSDNVTAVVALLEGDGLPAAGHSETVTQTFEVLQAFAGFEVKDPSRAEPTSSSPPPVRPKPKTDTARASKAPTVSSAESSTAKSDVPQPSAADALRVNWLVIGLASLVLTALGIAYVLMQQN